MLYSPFNYDKFSQFVLALTLYNYTIGINENNMNNVIYNPEELSYSIIIFLLYFKLSVIGFTII